MGIYTNSFQNLMHIYDKDHLTYEQKLVKLCEKVFDFNYNYKNDVTFKAFFEPYFIEHFFNEEFAFETLDYFKIKLKNRMQEVLPLYIPLYQAFYVNSIDLTLIEKEKAAESTNTLDENSETRNSVNDNTSLDVSSDLPANAITVNTIDDVKYATEGKRGKNTATSDEKSSTKNQSNTNRDIERIRMNNGLDNAVRYSTDFLNLFSEMINKFNDLFMVIF